MYHLITECGRWVIFEVNDNRQMANFAWAIQRFRCWCRQSQREVVRHVGDHFLQLRQINNAVALNKQMRTRGQQAVEPGPRHQLVEIAVIFQRLMADDRVHVRRAVVEIPTRTVGTTRRYMDKGQIRFREIRRYLRVHQRDLTRQRFKRSIQLTGQHTDILRTGADAEVIAPRKADQVTIALHHRIEQFVMRFAYLVNLPVSAVIQHGQTGVIPAPLFH